jgi:glutaconyl-CoA/methylmalonyl-CoA decarboxylase subunit gamma
MAKETIEAPMPGKILTVKVKVGDSVKADDEICILEAMKMENPIVSSISGKVTEICVTPNTMVETGQILAVIQG